MDRVQQRQIGLRHKAQNAPPRLTLRCTKARRGQSRSRGRQKISTEHLSFPPQGFQKAMARCPSASRQITIARQAAPLQSLPKGKSN
jgi:hypothetical protein